MKKTKSTSQIGAESPFSSKKSSETQKQLGRWPRLMSSKSISTLPALNKVSHVEQITSHQLETDDTRTCYENRAIVKPSLVREGTNNIRERISCLHRNIQKLQTQISESKRYNKKCKQYNDQLDNYAQICSSIQNLQIKLQIETQKTQQVNNNILMLKEEYISSKMNFEEALAEREFCDDVLERYQKEYENQGVLVIEMLEKQRQHENDVKTVFRLNKEIRQKQKNLEEWKNEIGFDLQEKVSKNKLTQLRIDLMKAEEQANVYAQKNNLIKLRQILCLYVNVCQQQNRVAISCLQINEESMEFFVCKNRMVDEFENAVIDYRGKEKQKYELKIIGKYFQFFRKIEQTINNPRLQLQKSINSQLTSQVCLLRKLLISTEHKLQTNQQQLTQFSQKLQISFANESVAVIEHLRQSTGRYELGEIKKKLKELKEEQKVRIDQIKQVYQIYDKCGAPKIRLTDVDFLNNLGELSKSQNFHQNQLNKLKCELTLEQKKKEEVQIMISEAVGKWGEISGKKEELKSLYRELNQLNKQRGLSQTLNFHQKFNQTRTKNLIRKPQILTHSMKETIRLKIEGRNKQNQNKIINNFSKQNSERLTNNKFCKQNDNRCAMEVCRTRKPSLSLFSSADGIRSKLNDRTDLTALLASKFNR